MISFLWNRFERMKNYFLVFHSVTYFLNWTELDWITSATRRSAAIEVGGPKSLRYKLLSFFLFFPELTTLFTLWSRKLRNKCKLRVSCTRNIRKCYLKHLFPETYRINTFARRDQGLSWLAAIHRLQSSI